MIKQIKLIQYRDLPNTEYGMKNYCVFDGLKLSLVYDPFLFESNYNMTIRI